MKNATQLGNLAVGFAAVAIGCAFVLPMAQSMTQDGFSILDGSAPTISAMIYAMMLPLLCVSAPGVLGRALGVGAAGLSGWACGQAAQLVQANEWGIALATVGGAMALVAATIAAMRFIAAYRRREVIRLVRRLHAITEDTTEALRERYHAVPLKRGGPNPIADAMLIDRLVNGAIGGVAGASDRNALFRDFLPSLRDLRDSVNHQHAADGYAKVCLDEHLRALVVELRREGVVPARRQAAVHGHGQTAH